MADTNIRWTEYLMMSSGPVLSCQEPKNVSQNTVTIQKWMAGPVNISPAKKLKARATICAQLASK